MARRQGATAVVLGCLFGLCSSLGGCASEASVSPSVSLGASTMVSTPVPRAPTGGMPATDGLVRSMEGRVVDRAAAGYLYLEVEDDAGQRVWVVSLMKDIAVGERVRVHALGARQDFTAKRLSRTFPELWFAVVRPVEAAPG